MKKVIALGKALGLTAILLLIIIGTLTFVPPIVFGIVAGLGITTFVYKSYLVFLED